MIGTRGPLCKINLEPQRQSQTEFKTYFCFIPGSMETTRAQESTNAIERMYITMRHLLNRGFYKPMGVSGETLRNALLQLRPEIYGTIA